MDTQTLIIDSKARFNHNLAKQYLKDKYQSKLTFADQNGLWVANVNLLSYLGSSDAEQLVLIDEYENPVQVNRIALLKKASEIYKIIMQQWHDEWATLEKKR